MTTPITTIPELEALPVGSVILDSDGVAWQRLEANWWKSTDGTGTGGVQGIFSPPWTLLHVPGEPAPAYVIDREALDVAIGGVLFNASNYPGPAQAYLWGRDIGPLRRKVADAVLAILPGKSEQEVRAEALRDAAAAIVNAPNNGYYRPSVWLYARADVEAGK